MNRYSQQRPSSGSRPHTRKPTISAPSKIPRGRVHGKNCVSAIDQTFEATKLVWSSATSSLAAASQFSFVMGLSEITGESSTLEHAAVFGDHRCFDLLPRGDQEVARNRVLQRARRDCEIRGSGQVIGIF